MANKWKQTMYNNNKYKNNNYEEIILHDMSFNERTLSNSESEPSFLSACLSTYLPLSKTFNSDKGSVVNTPNISKLSNILPMQHLTYKFTTVQTPMQTKASSTVSFFALQLYTTGCGCAHYPPFFTLSVYLPCNAAHHATCLFACLSVLFAQ